MLGKEVANLVLDFKTMKDPCDRACSYFENTPIFSATRQLTDKNSISCILNIVMKSK